MASSTTITDAELAIVNTNPDGEAYDLQYPKEIVTLIKITSVEHEKVIHQWVKIGNWVKKNYKTLDLLVNDKKRFEAAILLGRPLADRQLFYDRVPKMKSGEDPNLHVKRERLKKVDAYVRQAFEAIKKHSFPPAKTARPKAPAAPTAEPKTHGYSVDGFVVADDEGEDDEREGVEDPVAPAADEVHSAAAAAKPKKQLKIKKAKYTDLEAVDAGEVSDESMGPVAGRKERRDKRFATKRPDSLAFILLVKRLVDDMRRQADADMAVVLDDLELVRAGLKVLQIYVDNHAED
jgi:hypothetical protein